MLQRVQIPQDNDDLRTRIYGGEIFQFEMTPEADQLAGDIWQEVVRELGDDPRRAQFDLEDAEYFARVGRLRKLFYETPAWLDRTRALMAAVPRPGGSLFAPLPAAPGRPETVDPKPGCPFASRCPDATDRCRGETPAVHDVDGRLVRCHLYDPGANP